jgi:NADH:ubiquinone oxidoreductase subunit E
MRKAEGCTCNSAVTEQELAGRFEEVLADYKSKPGSLIPVLQIAQTMFGYLPERVIKRISEQLDKSYSEVAGVVGFYSFFSTVPRGKYLIRVCLGTACYVRGGNDVLNAVKQTLGIDIGQTTPDKMFTLDIGRCFGACGLAPVIMVNDTVHQRVKAAKIGELLAEYRSKGKKEKKA